jgi:hypothetical protein
MKRRTVCLLLSAFFCAGCWIQPMYREDRLPQAPDEPVPALTPYGIWADVPAFGRVWHPNVSFYWKPFSDGEWYWTEQGWLWHTDEPFGWIVYHYGYWTQESPLGWIWIPGYDWSPARVVWVFDDDLIGWAPMPPPGRSTVALYDPCAAGTWVLVPPRNFADGNVRRYTPYAPYPSHDISAHRTRSSAPDIGFVERRTNRPIDRAPIQRENVRSGGRDFTRVLPKPPSDVDKNREVTPPAEQPSQPRTTQGTRRTDDRTQTPGQTDQKAPARTPETQPAEKNAPQQPARTTETRAPRDTTKIQPQTPGQTDQKPPARTPVTQPAEKNAPQQPTRATQTRTSRDATQTQPQAPAQTDQKPPARAPATQPAKESAPQQPARTTETRAPRDTTKTQPQRR